MRLRKQRSGNCFLFIHHPYADALSGNFGAQLSCIKMASPYRHQMGHMASGHLLALCGNLADKVHEKDTRGHNRGRKDRRSGGV